MIQGNQWWVIISAVGFSIPLFIKFGFYRAIFRYVGTLALLSMARIFVAYTASFFVLFTFFGLEGVPRSIGVIQPLLLFIAIGATRFLLRYWLGTIGGPKVKHDLSQSIALIYGVGSEGRQLFASLNVGNEVLVKGFIDDDVLLQGNTINGVRIYPSSNLRMLIDKLGVTDVLLAIPEVDQAKKNKVIQELYGCRVRVRKIERAFHLPNNDLGAPEIHDLDMDDLLGRSKVIPDFTLLERSIQNKTILVTGAGGSIGGELCRQIISFSPATLILIDISEFALYTINQELIDIISSDENGRLQKKNTGEWIASSNPAPTNIIPCLCSVQDVGLVKNIFTKYSPDIVFHAAAYKHVPLVEINLAEGIRNNVFGTLNCAQASLEAAVSNFVLVSTDKAVRPTNIMGASKRIAEMVLQAKADYCLQAGLATKFSMVRFGNVLGSSGSVVPLFRSQIISGGPITLTDLEVTRYFMTIPEAAQLVIQSSAMARGGEVYLLDMGQPVRIYDLAIKMIYLSGLMVKDEFNPLGDIEIKVTGLRPGEKLYEELLIDGSPQQTDHPKIMKAIEMLMPWDQLEQELEYLNLALNSGDEALIKKLLKNLVPGYQFKQQTLD